MLDSITQTGQTPGRYFNIPDVYTYTEPKWKINIFIILIANIILNQWISLCLYTIGHITKAIICLTCIQGK